MRKPNPKILTVSLVKRNALRRIARAPRTGLRPQIIHGNTVNSLLDTRLITIKKVKGEMRLFLTARGQKLLAII